MKILILGAAGQIARMVTDNILEHTNFDLILYGRNVSQRLADKKNDRVMLVDGTFEDTDKIAANLASVDAVYINFVAKDDLIKPIVETLEASNTKRFIMASIPDVYEEVAGKFQKWYRENTGIIWTSPIRKAVDMVEDSSLDYVILRITWLYDDDNNKRLHVTEKGEPFVEAQVTRQAVAQFVTDLLTGKADYHRASLGLGEPGTAWEKPSFY